MKYILAATIVAMTVVSCGGAKKEESKTLVLYYSLTGTTQTVAKEIASQLRADVEEITCVNPYDTNFQACIQRCLQEREAGTVTEINPVKADLSKYDIIFVGYPVWFGTYAPPIATFLANNDLSGKKIIPFCTFGSGGLESSIKDLKAAQPHAEILPGYGIRAARMDAMKGEVTVFLVERGLTEGTIIKLDAFPIQHEVSADEAAIFDTAVDGYPMLHAKAVRVASRTLPNGTEYLFTAEDMSRKERGHAADDKKADVPPASELQIYVTVIDGHAPVFTKVVR